jgi:hypothetical protein
MRGRGHAGFLALFGDEAVCILDFGSPPAHDVAPHRRARRLEQRRPRRVVRFRADQCNIERTAHERLHIADVQRLDCNRGGRARLGERETAAADRFDVRVPAVDQHDLVLCGCEPASDVAADRARADDPYA